MAYDMYQEIILQHYRSPRNFGKMDAPDLAAEESNPNCGDQITMELKLDPGRARVEDVRFHGEGCAISVASASMFTEKVKGRPLDELRALTQEDILRMVGIPLSPVRVKCALTGFAAFGRALSGLRPSTPPASG
jgi:nitrogen fixation protein NifU and related proteins